MILMLLFSCAAVAQSLVKGSVRDKDDNPVAAATITVKGTKLSTAAAADGSFSIPAGLGDILVISSIGFQDYEVKVPAGKSLPRIILNPKAGALNDDVTKLPGVA